jgi:isoquinoline 1-oxidoreductase beta subunit
MKPNKTDITTTKADESTTALPDAHTMNRRAFLSTTSAVGGAMVVGFWLPPASSKAEAAVSNPNAVAAQPWYRDPMVPEINAWITIAPDETVTIRVANTEMGTGVFTSNPMMIVEELQCDWSKVRAEYASANRNVREKAPAWTIPVPGKGIYDPTGGGEPALLGAGTNGVYRRMQTSSSGSVREGRYYHQLAGAEARERLLLAAATEWNVPVASLTVKDGVITHAASKRRTTYGAMASRAAMIQLPDPSKIKLMTPDKFRLMGTEQKNFDVPLKVTGQAVYGIDVRLPGMLYAASKACPVWGGDVKSYDFDKVKNMPGVHSAVKFGGPGYISGGIAVVADTWWHAHKALEAMPIEWNTGANGSVSSASIHQTVMAAFDKKPDHTEGWGTVDEAVFQKAAKVVEATYTVPYVAHARMEPTSATAIVTANRVDMWTSSTQGVDGALDQAARAAGIAPENVYVHQCFIGGGYGGSGGGRAIPQAVAVAKTLNGRPVKLLVTREEDWGYGAQPRPLGIGIFKAALDAAGWPIALHARTSAGYPPSIAGGDQGIRGLSGKMPYLLPNYRYDAIFVETHVPVAARRATGSSINCFYVESFMDELAHAAGKDPYQYRRELIVRNTNNEFAKDWLRALDLVAKQSEWGAPLPVGWARGIAIDDRRRPTRNTISVCAEVLTVEVTKRGQVKLHRVDMVFDSGFGLVNPLSTRKQLEGQIAWGFSDTVHQAVTIKDGRAVETNFDTYPVSRMSEDPRQVNIQFMPTNRWVYGTGEEAIPQIAPAITQAVFTITGKRIRSLPLKNQDLSWG